MELFRKNVAGGEDVFLAVTATQHLKQDVERTTSSKLAHGPVKSSIDMRPHRAKDR
jgi:hypothetical protein